MIEQVFPLTPSDARLIEKVITDDNVHYLHMVLPEGEGLPEHTTNAPVYMTVLKGRLSLRLAEQEAHEYWEGTVLKIPMNTRMHARNLSAGLLELTVVKAPAPQP